MDNIHTIIGSEHLWEPLAWFNMARHTKSITTTEDIALSAWQQRRRHFHDVLLTLHHTLVSDSAGH